MLLCRVGGSFHLQVWCSQEWRQDGSNSQGGLLGLVQVSAGAEVKTSEREPVKAADTKEQPRT